MSPVRNLMSIDVSESKLVEYKLLVACIANAALALVESVGWAITYTHGTNSFAAFESMYKPS